MFDIMVITSPREGPYLAGTLDEMQYQFDVIPHVFAEPGTQPPPGKYHWHQNLFRCGMVCNWFYAARHMLEVSNQPYIMCCEDDIRFEPECGYRLRTILKSAHRDKKLGFISPYCSKYNCYGGIVDSNKWVKAHMPVGGWCGSLCMVFPRAALEFLLSDWLRFRKHTIVNYPKPIHLDYAIGQVLKEAGYNIVTHHPTLVFHTGEVSTHPPNNAPVNRNNPAREPAV